MMMMSSEARRLGKEESDKGSGSSAIGSSNQSIPGEIQLHLELQEETESSIHHAHTSVQLLSNDPQQQEQPGRCRAASIREAAACGATHSKHLGVISGV